MLKQIFIVAGVVFCTILFLLYFFQRRLIYFPTTEVPQLNDYHANDMKLITLRTKDKIFLSSWYIPAVNNQPTLLFLHGNAGHIGHRMPLIRQFIHAGFGVFLLEYRGYGGNNGTPNEQGFYEDARAAIRFLHKNGLDSKRIVLYGESLGTGVATKLATEYSVCSVILQSPFTSLDSLSRYHYPWIFIKPWDKFNSLERMHQIYAPLLVLHGKMDTVVPFDEGIQIFNQANQPKKMLSFDNKNHNDLWSATEFPEAIINFIKTHC